MMVLTVGDPSVRRWLGDSCSGVGAWCVFVSPSCGRFSSPTLWCAILVASNRVTFEAVYARPFWIVSITCAGSSHPRAERSLVRVLLKTHSLRKYIHVIPIGVCMNRKVHDSVHKDEINRTRKRHDWCWMSLMRCEPIYQTYVLECNVFRGQWYLEGT